MFKYSNNRFVSIKNNIEINLIISKKLFSKIPNSALEQLKGITTIPNICSPIISLPDIQTGFGVPIGSCFVSELENANISVEAIGFDINCGIRLIKTNIFKKQVSEKQLLELSKALKQIPLGLSKDGLKVTNKDLKEILLTGVDWCVSKKYCKVQDRKYIEYNGSFKDAKVTYISKQALERGKSQIGTLGQGNHFIDLMFVDNIFNKNIAKQFNLQKNQLCIMIHTGSRGLGHQVANDFYKLVETKKPISYFSFNSKDAQKYYVSMLAAANFAFVNRCVLSYKVQEIIKNTLNIGQPIKFELLYDFVHNLATIEKHNSKKYLVHRKGAARAIPKQNLPKSSIFKKTGTPIILPGSMLHRSFILAPDSGLKKTFETVAHGSGRLLTRIDAKSKLTFKELNEYMLKNKIILAGRSENIMREEQPASYKDSNDVLKSMELAKLVKKVVSLKPLIVLTG